MLKEIEIKNLNVKDVLFNSYVTNRLNLYDDLLLHYNEFSFKFGKKEILSIELIKNYLQKSYSFVVDNSSPFVVGDLKNSLNIYFFAYFMAIVLYIMKNNNSILEDEKKAIESLKFQSIIRAIINDDYNFVPDQLKTVKEKNNFLLYNVFCKPDVNNSLRKQLPCVKELFWNIDVGSVVDNKSGMNKVDGGFGDFLSPGDDSEIVKLFCGNKK